MAVLEDLALFVGVLSGLTTLLGGLAAFLTVASTRFRGWLLGKLGIRRMQRRLDDIQAQHEQSAEEMREEIKRAAHARRKLEAIVVALAYAIESEDDDVQLRLEEIVAMEDLDGDLSAVDLLDGAELITRGSSGNSAGDD